MKTYLFPAWQTTDQLPISFRYGGQPLQGIPAAWNPRIEQRQPDPRITETLITAVSPEGLEIRMEHRRYLDFAAEKYAAFLTNRGSADSPLIEDLRITGLFPGHDALLYHGNGDTLRTDGYDWQTEPVVQTPLVISPCDDGTSCNGAFPYMRLAFAQGGVNLAFGWSGTWVASFTQTEQGVALAMGQKRFRTVIHPGETMRVPSLTAVAYAGHEDEGRNTWRRWYFAHILPRPKGKPLAPLCCMHLFQAEGKPEFTGATEENQLTAMAAYHQAGLRPDVWWIDAGWYPCDFQWRQTGNWVPHPEHFPHGLSPIGRKCRETGMDFLLWFEPERIWKGTEFATRHPEWVLASEATDNCNLLVNLGNTACCDYVIDMLDRLIKESGVTIYRQDFNFHDKRGNVSSYWQASETENRIGAPENLHIQGYYRLWDTLLARNPGLLIDSCASGGRRNDIETMSRSVTLHYTDVGYGHHPIKLKQHRQMFEWIPYFRAHNQNWCSEDGTYDQTARDPDRYAYYVAMAPALTDITEYNANESALALAREMQEIWRQAANRMIGTDYYPLTPCRQSAQDFYAAQFHDPATGKGLVQLVNGAAAMETEFCVKLKGLKPEAHYQITSAEAGAIQTLCGENLLAGVSLHLAKKSADIWFYEQK